MKHLYIDLDDTLIPFDSLPRFLLPLLWRVGWPGLGLAFRLPYLGLRPHRHRIRPGVAQALRGQSVDAIELWSTDWVSRQIVPHVRRQLLPTDIPFTICSMSLDLVVHPLARALKGHGIGTALERREGVFTGQLDGPQCGGEGKRQLLLEDCERRQIDPQDVGLLTDHHRDIQALEAVGTPRLVNPTRELRTWAAGRDVEILTID